MKTFINNKRLAALAGVDFDSDIIQPGPIVYSRTHLVCGQFNTLAKFGPCVLVTSFSDACCDSSMVRALPKNVRHWFTNNLMAKSPRVSAVPIGLRTSPKGEEVLRKAMSKGRKTQRNLVYMNFYRKIKRKVNPRRGMYEFFQPFSWITTEGGFEHVPMDHFYDQISRHPYVISPPGAGPDCHRHWEAILLGSIPIVKRSRATDVLKGLPCLRVDNWGEVTEERLRKELPRLQQLFNSPAMEIIWFDYWEKRIKEA